MGRSAELTCLLHQCAGLIGLPGPAEPCPDRLDWSRWLELVVENELGPLFGSRLCGPGAPELDIPEWVEHALVRQYVGSAHEASFLTSELHRVLNLVSDVCEPIALKGAALAHTLYDEAAERPMSDLDLLCRRSEEVGGLAEVLAEEGYRPTQADRAHHHHVAPMANSVTDVVVELHTNLTTPGLPKGAMARLLQRTERVGVGAGGEGLLVLDRPARLLHHALHAVREVMGAPLLRNLFEVAWMISRLSDDEQSVCVDLATELGVEVPARRAVTMAAKLFGAPAIMEPTRRGALELWVALRLERTHTSEVESSRWQRFVRGMADRHVESIWRGAGNRNPLPLVGLVLASLGRASLTRARRILRPPWSRLKQSSVHVASVGGGLLAHDQRTGYVHVLDSLTAEVWRAAREQPKPAEIRAALQRTGMAASTSRVALKKLKNAGLLS